MTSFFERRDRVRAALLTGDAWAWLQAPWLEMCGRLLQLTAWLSPESGGSQAHLCERGQSRAAELRRSESTTLFRRRATTKSAG